MKTMHAVSFKPEWNGNDFTKMKLALSRNFLCRPLSTHRGSATVYCYKSLVDLLGLPYTSGSDVAGVWVTNTELASETFPGYHYSGFAIGDNGKCYGMLMDAAENEKTVLLA
jgi:hypothetical protein